MQIVEVLVLTFLLIGLPFLGTVPFPLPTARAAGVLTVEVLAAYNLVVDSNVTSPSTYAPSVATVAGKFCNTGDATLTDVQGFIGNYIDGVNDTPGTYPSRNSATFPPSDPLYNTGVYAFSHVGGRLGTADASRFIGPIPPGECRYQYWHFTYPQCSNSETPPCSGTPVWGDSIKPDDDLWLQFDIWGTSTQGSNDNATWTMTMRNEISAMANKIKPNPDGRWFNTKDEVIEPGGFITSNGILYELGNINQGFDNNGDYLPDYNAWMQPIGDPGYDPSCFRLIKTSGVITISRSGGNPDMIVPFDEQLYFTDLPPDNTGVRGKIFYTFQAMDGPCQAALSPYQEVASGYDNEKFNGDYGLGIPPLGSYEPKVTIDKAASPDIVDLGGTVSYQIPFQNSGTTGFGIPLSAGGLPLVISDTIPAGLEYVAGSAGYILNFTPNNGVLILFSTDDGATWTSTEPVPASDVTTIQWWLNDTLPAGEDGYATFQAQVPVSYSGPPFIENCADSRLGDGAPFDRACDVTMVRGNSTIGDYVWRDENNNGQQDDGAGVGIDGVTLSLYWDKDGDGTLSDGDILLMTEETAGGGLYDFTELPNGDYLVEVDSSDADIPVGYRPTTPVVHAVTIPSAGTDYNDADFGFGPAFSLDKQLTSGNPAYEGDQVIFTIDLTNNRPGDGSGDPQPCAYTDWADALETSYVGTGNKAWTNPGNLPGDPDSVYATAPFNNSGEFVGVTTWSLGSYAGQPTLVEVLLPIQVNPGWVGGETFAARLIDCGTNGVCEGTAQGVPGGDDFIIGSRTLNPATLSDGTLAIDFTVDRNWTWSDFNGSNIVIEFITSKSGKTTGSINVDAVAFRVSNGLTCNDPNDIIDPLPLTDTFDPTKLQFVSADPAESSVVGGTITWDNLGPLFPGETKQVTVVFLALEPPDNDGDGENDPTTHENCANVTGATFIDGTPVNDAQDCVIHDILPTGEIGDTVWNDNGFGGGTADNGVQDGGEYGIPNVTIWLYSDPNGDGDPSDGVLIDTETTDANGNYLFTGVRDGSYVVVVDTASLPGSSFTQTGDPDVPGANCGGSCDNQGGTTINNNNGDPTDDNDYSLDFGYRVPNTIYGHVWEDNDGDAIWDSGENGFNNITVYLDDCGADGICGNGDDGPTVSTTTDSTGYYEFSDLPDGNYRVRVDTTTLPGGAVWTNTVDPEGSPGDSQSNVIAASGGNIYGPYDFGYYRTGTFSLGDTIYTDWDGDGNQDTGEEGIPNITILLYQDDNGDGIIDPLTDGLIATTSADANGVYGFSNLAAQSYIVVVDEADSDFPGNYYQTGDPDEAGTCSTCDAQGSATLGPDDLTVDFGYQPVGNGAIGDFVWQEQDGDGIQEPGEPGIAGITLILYEDDNANSEYDPSIDAYIADTETDATGFYLFSYLLSDHYLVDVDTADPDLPIDVSGNPYVLSSARDPYDVKGSGGGLLGGGGILGLGGPLAPGEIYLDADFGFTPGGIIGDYLWIDVNQNANQDIDEPPIPNVTVSLYEWNDDGDGLLEAGETGALLDTTTTDAGGWYEFTSLPAGDYAVVVNTADPDMPTGATQTADPDETSVCSTCDSQSGTSIGEGHWIDRSRDFGYAVEGTIGDTLWIDADGDGVRDPEEAGIPYITLELRDGICTPGVDCPTTETDSDGWYYFGNLDTNDQSYTVVVDTSDPDFPAGLTLTYDPDEGNNCTLCDNQGSTTLTSAAPDDLTIDFGYQYNGAYNISGHIFYDDDNDGGYYTPALGDLPYENVTVYLWNSNGFLIATTTTDASGTYNFTGLPNGTYTVSMNPNDPVLQDTTMTVEPDVLPGACGVCNNYTTVTINNADVTDRDFGFWASPTDVELLSFTATGQLNYILVAWETASEIDTLGFNLYRREVGTEAYTQLNETLIPSKSPGGGQGASYSFIDADIVAGVSYQYLLEDVDFEGKSTPHGPVVATAPYAIFLPLLGK